MNNVERCLLYSQNPDMQGTLKILVIRFARLGDVILLVPALRALRRRFPNAQIDVLVDSRFADVLRMCSAVTEVVAVDRIALRDESRLKSIASIFGLMLRLRRKKYDIVLDCHSFRETHLLTWFTGARWRQGLKRVHSEYLSFCFNRSPTIEDDSAHVSSVFLSMMEPLGCQSLENDHLLDVPPCRQEWTAQFLSSALSHRVWFVGLYVGAGSHSRTWPSENFAELARRILCKPEVRIILFCGPDEEDLLMRCCSGIAENSRIICAPNLSLPNLAAMLSRCTALVSNDTGPMHLGSASGVPTLGLFSVARPDHYHPLGRLARFIKSESIEEIPVETVFQELEDLLKLCEKGKGSDFPAESR